jgi:hypothetical protein
MATYDAEHDLNNPEVAADPAAWRLWELEVE